MQNNILTNKIKENPVSISIAFFSSVIAIVSFFVDINTNQHDSTIQLKNATIQHLKTSKETKETEIKDQTITKSQGELKNLQRDLQKLKNKQDKKVVKPPKNKITTEHTRLSNTELKKLTLDYVNKLRNFYKENFDKFRKQITDDDIRKIAAELRFRYMSDYKVDCLQLRTELLLRLKRPIMRKRYGDYFDGSSLYEIGRIAEILENYAKSLLL